MGQKRGRDSKAQTVESKKRKKAGKANPASDDGSWDGVVGIDDLNWKEVTLPDRMENAEGFFGLEEIDGVDVIKLDGSAGVQFKVSGTNSSLFCSMQLINVHDFVLRIGQIWKAKELNFKTTLFGRRWRGMVRFQRWRVGETSCPSRGDARIKG